VGVIQTVLKEEFDRLKILQQRYLAELDHFPKGAVSKRRRGEKFYLYLIQRQGKRVKTEYIGNWDSQKAQSVCKRIQERKELEIKLRQVSKDLAELERALSG